MLDDLYPETADPSTAQGGFFVDVPARLPADATSLMRQYSELEERYRNLIDRLPAVIYIDSVDEGDAMIDVGPGVLELFGLTREEWIARRSRAGGRSCIPTTWTVSWRRATAL